MRSKYLIGIIAVGLAFAAADCGKKARRNGDGSTAAVGAGASASGAAASQAQPSARGRGRIEVKGADFLGHRVLDAATGAEAAVISSLDAVIEIPAGTYDVEFGKTLWKGVVVEADKTTTLAPGELTLKRAALAGHEVADAATGAVQGVLSATDATITLVPGKYLVKFGPLAGPVTIEAGQAAIIEPGLVEVSGVGAEILKIYDASGAAVADVSNIRSSAPLPPGSYSLDIDGRRVAFTIEEGKTTSLKR